MPTYAYEALSRGGARSLGTVVAPTRADAIRRLLAGGHNVLDLREENADRRKTATGFGFRGPSMRLSLFTRQLATLAESGVPLVQSLDVLGSQMRDRRLARILADIRESIEGGSTLADALRRHPRVFPKVMPDMVRVGETGGTLDEVLLRLAELFEKEEELRGEVRAAMAYPLLVLFLGFLSAGLLIAFLIPRLKSLFEDVGQALPLPTRILLGISTAVTEYGWLLLIAGVASVAIWRAALRHPRAKLGLDRWKLLIPWLGNLVRTVAVARFARLLGTLLHSGTSMVEATDNIRHALGNEVIAAAVGGMSDKIRSGGSVASAMREAGVFPPLSIQMAAVGEETGRLDQMLIRVAEAYEREAAVATRVMTSLLAPALILCVAAVVGFIILSIVLPIFQLSSVMG